MKNVIVNIFGTRLMRVIFSAALITACGDLDMVGHDECNTLNDCPGGYICSTEGVCVLTDTSRTANDDSDQTTDKQLEDSTSDTSQSVDTADTSIDTADTSVDTSDTSVDTADTSVDTADTSVDTIDTLTPIEFETGFVDSATSSVVPETGAAWNQVTAMTGCGCNDATEVCGVDGACVPRCDAEGRCIEGITDGTLTPIALEGSKLFLVQEPAYDALENPLHAKMLWVLDLDTAQLSVVWEQFDDYMLLGVSPDGATVLIDQSTAPEFTVTKVFADGSVENIVLPDGFSPSYSYGENNIALDGNWLYSGGRVKMTPDTIENVGIRRFSIDGSGTLETVLSGQDIISREVALDLDWSYENEQYAHVYVMGVQDELILFSDNNAAFMYRVGDAPESMPGQYKIATMVISGDGAICVDDVGWGYIRAQSYSGTSKNLYFYDAEEIAFSGFSTTALLKEYDGWVYLLDPALQNLVAFPLTVARAHQTLFSVEILPLESWGITRGVTAGGEAYIHKFNFPVFFGSHGMVWSQFVRDEGTEDVLRTVIGSVPLPPRMCDAELPCTGEGETCGADGYCTRP